MEVIAKKLDLEYFTLYENKWNYYEIEKYSKTKNSNLSNDQAFRINIET